MCSNTYLLSPLVPGNCILDRALKQFVKSHPEEGEVIRLCHHSTYTGEYIHIQICTTTNVIHSQHHTCHRALANA